MGAEHIAVGNKMSREIIRKREETKISIALEESSKRPRKVKILLGNVNRQ